MKSLSSSDQLVQSLIRTQFQKDEDVFIVFEKMLEANNICVM